MGSERRKAGPRLRIAGGTWRGRSLTSAPGARPTEQRVREALFSIWGEAVIGAKVLDLYCGGGAVALEALSRGAREAVAVDSSAAALRTVAANREALRADDLRSLRLSIPRQLHRLVDDGSGRFDLVFADPPYELRDHQALVTAVAPLLAPGGELVLEHAVSVASPESVGSLSRIDHRTYGGSALSRYRHRSDAP